jgi:hypothetical protein
MLDDDRARDHGLAALDAANNGDSEEAAALHEKAAQRHERVAAGGDLKRGEASRHRLAAKLHKQAAAMHTIAAQGNGDEDEDEGNEEATENRRRLVLNSQQRAEAQAEAVLNAAFDSAGGCAEHLRADVVRRRYEEVKGRLPGGGGLPNDRIPIQNVKVPMDEFDEIKAASARHRQRVANAKVRERASAEAYVANAMNALWGPDEAWEAASRRNLIQGPFPAASYTHSWDTSTAGIMQGSATSASQDDEFDNPGMRYIQASPEGSGTAGFEALAGARLDATEQAAVDAERQRRLGLSYADTDEDELTAPGSMDQLLQREMRS